MIENHISKNNKILELLKCEMKKYNEKVPISYYCEIIKSGIEKFTGEKEYIDTSCVEGVNNISNGDTITYNKRPSRANMQPIKDSVWFAKMKDSNKIILITDNDADILENNILSTGYLGLIPRKNIPLSLLFSILITDDFHIQRNLNSVGTTMSGINNETFNKILAPKLDLQEIKNFGDKYNKMIQILSYNRMKINQLNKLKNLLLIKYFN